MRWALIVVVVLAACSGSKSSPSAGEAARSASSFVAPSSTPTTSSTTTSTTVPKHVASDATAIARRIGCAHVETQSDVSTLGDLPKPIRSVGCTISGVDISIDLYALHSDIQRYLSPGGRTAVCAVASAFGFHTLYSVVGYDFTAQAQTHGGNDSTLAQAQALGRALGLPVTTIRC